MHGHPPPRPNACEEKQAWGGGATRMLRDDFRLVESGRGGADWKCHWKGHFPTAEK